MAGGSNALAHRLRALEKKSSWLDEVPFTPRWSKRIGKYISVSFWASVKKKGVPTPNIHTHGGGWMDAESLRPRHDVETMVETMVWWYF